MRAGLTLRKGVEGCRHLSAARKEQTPTQPPLFTPPTLHAALSCSVVGQEHVKRRLAVEVVSHFQRCEANRQWREQNSKDVPHKTPATLQDDTSKVPAKSPGVHYLPLVMFHIKCHPDVSSHYEGLSSQVLDENRLRLKKLSNKLRSLLKEINSHNEKQRNQSLDERLSSLKPLKAKFLEFSRNLSAKPVAGSSNKDIDKLTKLGERLAEKLKSLDQSKDDNIQSTKDILQLALEFLGATVEFNSQQTQLGMEVLDGIVNTQMKHVDEILSLLDAHVDGDLQIGPVQLEEGEEEEEEVEEEETQVNNEENVQPSEDTQESTHTPIFKSSLLASADQTESLAATVMSDHGVSNFTKANILLMGPTGSGKTLMARTLAKVLDVPILIYDVTALTAAGYIGDDIQTIFRRLLDICDWDEARASRAIVYLDEIDKCARRGVTGAIDVGGEAVQHSLLKVLEGTRVTVDRGSVNARQTATLDTSDMLFICAGAFTGIDKIVARRTLDKSLGFSSTLSTQYSETADLKVKNALYQNCLPQDLFQYGFIQEFVGRFTSILSTNHLTEQELRQILTEPTNSVVNQLKAQFRICFPQSVSLTFTDQALGELARASIKSRAQVGARGLRLSVENLVHDLQYSLYEKPHITHVVVDDKVVRGEQACLEFTQEEFEQSKYCETGSKPSPTKGNKKASTSMAGSNA